MASFAKTFESMMKPHVGEGGGGGYANYYTHDATRDGIKAAFGEVAYQQLQKTKLTYDPNNIFASNQNISVSHEKE
jgi:FAD/FMN-containing dehydrogenase